MFRVQLLASQARLYYDTHAQSMRWGGLELCQVTILRFIVVSGDTTSATRDHLQWRSVPDEVEGLVKGVTLIKR